MVPKPADSANISNPYFKNTDPPKLFKKPRNSVPNDEKLKSLLASKFPIKYNDSENMSKTLMLNPKIASLHNKSSIVDPKRINTGLFNPDEFKNAIVKHPICHRKNTIGVYCNGMPFYIE